MNEKAKEVYQYIGRNQDTKTEVIVKYLMEKYGLTEKLAKDAIFRWAFADTQWFINVFKETTTQP